LGYNGTGLDYLAWATTRICDKRSAKFFHPVNLLLLSLYYEVKSMCRNIKQLRTHERPPTDEELELAALQFVRKVSGYRKPSRANEAAFSAAVAEIAAATRRLFDGLIVR
jgi:hypothetical protein